MRSRDELVGNPDHGTSRFCFARENHTYLVYLPSGGTTQLDLSKAKGEADVLWFNPRSGGKLQSGSVKSVAGGNKVELGTPPSDADSDWLAVVRMRHSQRETRGKSPSANSGH